MAQGLHWGWGVIVGHEFERFIIRGLAILLLQQQQQRLLQNCTSAATRRQRFQTDVLCLFDFERRLVKKLNIGSDYCVLVIPLGG